jgi:hypothetical protein
MRQIKRKKWLIIPLALGAIAIFIELFKLLWNNVIPEVFHFEMINYWQSLGILLISKILFSGFGFKKGRDSFRKKHLRFAENLSTEEKMKLREEWRRRFSDR